MLGISELYCIILVRSHQRVRRCSERREYSLFLYHNNFYCVGTVFLTLVSKHPAAWLSENQDSVTAVSAAFPAPGANPHRGWG